MALPRLDNHKPTTPPYTVAPQSDNPTNEVSPSSSSSNNSSSSSSTNSSSNTPNSSNVVTSPTVRTSEFRTDSEVLRFIADHMETGLPQEHAHLLDKANEIIARRRNFNAARGFTYVGNDTNVQSVLSRLDNAAVQGHIPHPYPIATDPLQLATWAGRATEIQVAFVAKRFPDLSDALYTFWNKGPVD